MINVVKTYLPPLREYVDCLQKIWETRQVTNDGEFEKKLIGKLKKYLDDINHLRNTIHPKSLNSPQSSYLSNRVIQEPVDKLFKKLDRFISLIQRVY